MTYLIILAALVLVPTLVIIVLKVNAAIAFMSLCLGSVLVSYTASDIHSIISSFSAKQTETSVWLQVCLLAVPFVLAILFTRKSIRGGKQFLNGLVALATGLLFALLLTPLLSSGLQHHIEHEALWRQLDNLQTAVLLGGAAFSLLFLLMSHRHHRSGDEKKHGKH